MKTLDFTLMLRTVQSVISARQVLWSHFLAQKDNIKTLPTNMHVSSVVQLTQEPSIALTLKFLKQLLMFLRTPQLPLSSSLVNQDTCVKQQA
jgi:hypothetical protein